MSYAAAMLLYAVCLCVDQMSVAHPYVRPHIVLALIVRCCMRRTTFQPAAFESNCWTCGIGSRGIVMTALIGL
jgi:hypothetical protein